MRSALKAFSLRSNVQCLMSVFIGEGVKISGIKNDKDVYIN